MTDTPSRFKIEVEAGRDPLGRTPDQRLRGALKVLLRGFALRAVSVSESVRPVPACGEPQTKPETHR